MITIDQVEMVMIIMDDDENDDGASWHVWRCGCGLVDGFKYSGLYKRSGREREPVWRRLSQNMLAKSANQHSYSNSTSYFGSFLLGANHDLFEKIYFTN